MIAPERLRARLLALLNKTVPNGCTEAEALAAAEKARAIMAEHGLNESALRMSQARAEETIHLPDWHLLILTAVSKCTNTAVLVQRAAYVFVGAELGPEIAVYLRDVALRAVESGVVAFRLTPAVAGQRLFVLRDRAERDFTSAFAGRLAERLVEIFHREIDDEAFRRAVAHRDALYPGVQLHAGRSRVRDRAAFAAGAYAADAVPLHHGVSTSPRRMIEGSGP